MKYTEENKNKLVKFLEKMNFKHFIPCDLAMSLLYYHVDHDQDCTYYKFIPEDSYDMVNIEVIFNCWKIAVFAGKSSWSKTWVNKVWGDTSLMSVDSSFILSKWEHVESFSEIKTVINKMKKRYKIC